jgi:hypothetical protein
MTSLTQELGSQATFLFALCKSAPEALFKKRARALFVNHGPTRGRFA